MKILASRLEDSVVCTLPDRHRFEIFMVSVEGEDVYHVADISEAVSLLQWYLQAQCAAH